MKDTSRHLSQPQSKPRGLLCQVVLAAVLISLGVFATRNLQAYYAPDWRDFGLGFLTQPAIFEVSNTLIPFAEREPIWRALLLGALNSILAAVLAIVLSTCLAAVIALARLSRHRLLAILAEIYCNVFRNVPLLVQLFIQFGIWFAAFRMLPSVPRHVEPDTAVLFTRDGILLPWISGFGTPLIALLAAYAVVLSLWRVGSKGSLSRLQHIPAWFIWSLPLAMVVVFAWLAGYVPQVEWPATARGEVISGARISVNLVVITVGLATYASSPLSDVFTCCLLDSRKSQSKYQTQGLTETRCKLSWTDLITTTALPAAQCHLDTLKNTALGFTVGYFGFNKAISGVWTQAVEPFMLSLIAAGFYLVICLPVSLLLQRVHERESDERGGSANRPASPTPKIERSTAARRFSGRLRQAFFYDVYGGTITVVLGVAIFLLGIATWEWITDTLNLFAVRAGCHTAVDSCLALVAEKFQFSRYLATAFWGYYPADKIWRAYGVFALFVGMLAAWSAPHVPFRILFWLTSLSVGAMWYICLGSLPGSPAIESRSIGGLLATLILATTVIAAGFAFGCVLALGSFSRQPLVRLVCQATALVINSIPPYIVIVNLGIVASILLLPENSTSPIVVIVALASPIIVSSAEFAAVIRKSILSDSESTLGCASLAHAIRSSVPALTRTAVRQLHYTTFFLASIFAFEFFRITRLFGTGLTWLELHAVVLIFTAIVYLLLSNLILFAGKRVAQRLKAQSVL